MLNQSSSLMNISQEEDASSTSSEPPSYDKPSRRFELRLFWLPSKLVEPNSWLFGSHVKENRPLFNPVQIRQAMVALLKYRKLDFVELPVIEQHETSGIRQEAHNFLHLEVLLESGQGFGFFDQLLKPFVEQFKGLEYQVLPVKRTSMVG